MNEKLQVYDTKMQKMAAEGNKKAKAFDDLYRYFLILRAVSLLFTDIF